MPTFDYCPSVSSSSQEESRVLVTSYGDGYQQRIGDGINIRKRIWNVTFNGTAEYTNEIRDFLRTSNGVDSFDWTPPDGEAGKWICTSWNKTYFSSAVHSIKATFVEVFE
jgi:phage-related protein